MQWVHTFEFRSLEPEHRSEGRLAAAGRRSWGRVGLEQCQMYQIFPSWVSSLAPTRRGYILKAAAHPELHQPAFLPAKLAILARAILHCARLSVLPAYDSTSVAAYDDSEPEVGKCAEAEILTLKHVRMFKPFVSIATTFCYIQICSC